MHILAYIDPGVGTLIWQSVIGVFVGIFFYLRKTRRWIGEIMRKMFRNEPKPVKIDVVTPMDKGGVEAERR